jgi:hypothetical protein
MELRILELEDPPQNLEVALEVVARKELGRLVA